MEYEERDTNEDLVDERRHNTTKTNNTSNATKAAIQSLRNRRQNSVIRSPKNTNNRRRSRGQSRRTSTTTSQSSRSHQLPISTPTSSSSRRNIRSVSPHERRLSNNNSKDSTPYYKKNNPRSDEFKSKAKEKTSVVDVAKLQRQVQKRILLEYKQLKDHSPTGIYVVPSFTSSFLFYGVIFLKRGVYRNAIFKFKIHLPDMYQYERDKRKNYPTVRFLVDVVNPYVNLKTGELDLIPGFPHWDPHKHALISVVLYMKKIFFMKSFQEPPCPSTTSITNDIRGNHNAWLLQTMDPDGYQKLVYECVDDSQRHVKDEKGSTIRFASKDELKYEVLRSLMHQHLEETSSTNTTSSEEQDQDGFEVEEREDTNNTEKHSTDTITPLTREEIVNMVAEATTQAHMKQHSTKPQRIARERSAASITRSNSNLSQSSTATATRSSSNTRTAAGRGSRRRSSSPFPTLRSSHSFRSVSAASPRNSNQSARSSTPLFRSLSRTPSSVSQSHQEKLQHKRTNSFSDFVPSIPSNLSFSSLTQSFSWLDNSNK